MLKVRKFSTHVQQRKSEVTHVGSIEGGGGGPCTSRLETGSSMV